MKEGVTLIKGEKIGIETDYRDQLPVNMYAVKKDILKAQGYMLAYPGIESFATVTGVDRGGVYNERFEAHYRVSGEKLVSVSSTGVVTELGTISGTTQARLEGLYSFNTQGIITDGKFWLYDPVDGLNEVVDADLGSPLDGVWVDGYYFLTDGEYIYHTDADDETSIDPLKFATAEFMPDPSIGVSKTQDNKVMVWGRYTLEYFIDAAADDFAFTRVETRAQKIGIVATHAKAEGQKGWYITGGRKNESIAVHLVGIGSSEKVSTREIDKIIEQYSEPDLADMRMECRVEKGTCFVLVHLPDETLCFNESIASVFGVDVAWTILKTGLEGGQNYRGINGVFDARCGKWIYGDKRDAYLGKLSEVFTQYGAIQEWELYTPLLKMETYSVDKIEIETITGYTAEVDAKVAFSLTNDGSTYGLTTSGLTLGAEEWQLYGQPLDYSQRFFLRRLGYVGDWVGFKFRGTTKSRMAFGLMEVTYS